MYVLRGWKHHANQPRSHESNTMTFVLRTICMILMMLALLAGCGAAVSVAPIATVHAPATAPIVTATALPTGTAILPTPTMQIGTPLPEGMLMHYERHGCLAGINEVLVINVDGTAHLTATDGKTSQLSLAPEQLTALRQLLETPAFRALQPPPLPMAMDQCFYRVATNTPDGMSRTITSVGERDDPAPLFEVVQTLEQIRARFPVKCYGRCH